MKYIFVIGGVVSSLGKGLTAASVGALLECNGLCVDLKKFDPYLNVDPGTMSPYQHGEVYVLDDGAETDLDLGHYERFTHAQLGAGNSTSSGKIYQEILRKERQGDYLGKTVQVIPHVTDEIRSRIESKKQNVDVTIVELGGTVGDMEGMAFLEAIRQLALQVGRENVLFLHVTLLPYVHAADEVKTKPAQQSVALLRGLGIRPDLLFCRTDRPLTDEIRTKLSLFCEVPKEAVIQELDVAHSIYEVPLMLHEEGVDGLILKHFGWSDRVADLSRWKEVVEKIRHPKNEVTIAVVGKYIELQDAYKSVYEALAHGAIANQCKLNVLRIDSEKAEQEDLEKLLSGCSGVLIPGGFGDRGIEGKIRAIQYAREKKLPFFGICLGMQLAVIEFGRNVAQLKRANSTEFDPKTPYPLILLMADQEGREMGGSMRLGAYSCALDPESLVAKCYGTKRVSERHRHRYEFNNDYADTLEKNGLSVAGRNLERNLVEAIELRDHPWFVGVQYHPEFRSKPHQPHPLFSSFVATAMKKR